MSGIVKTFVDHLIENRATWWLILDCGHWYHWTGAHEPKADDDFDCQNCKPLPVVVKGVPPSPAAASQKE